jgi:hypothetical protein
VDVAVVVDTTPSPVAVFLGRERLGSSDEALRLPRSDRAVTLTLRAPGYKDLELDVLPARDLELTARLQRRPRPAVPRPKAPVPKTRSQQELEF